ncbi:MAG TPA: glutamine cyclotransferase [Polyangiales bacterium]|nr:glutamine cyclotransferase [Polyangiales bacterium]
MRTAQVIRELAPLDETQIHGVTYDGERVWFARDNELIAFDPKQEKVVRRFAIPGAGAGTAFDGTHLYQLANEEILVVDPENGRTVRRLPAPKGGSSGMAYSDGYLWVGQYRAAKIQKLDAQTGEVVKTLSSDRFVTGVSCVDGELWHATGNEGPCELRKLSPDGTVQESYRVDDVGHISGIERTPEGFWCGGEHGKLRLLRT